jgi:regulation of enolase protein 1 (concanavalin A-like superfamily)
VKIIGHRRGVVRHAYAIFVLAFTLAAHADAQTLPAGWTVSNIGAPAIGGSAIFNSGTFSVTGSGTDTWGRSDQFTFVHRQISGDATIVTRVATLQSIDAWSKAGVMIRDSLAAGSKHAFVFATPSSGIDFRRRTSTGGTTSHTNGGTGTAPTWLKLERQSSKLTAYWSADGATWTTIGSSTVSMGSTVYVGLAVTSHDAARTATATFSSVTTTAGAGGSLPAGWTAADIGAPALVGSTQYASGTFTVEGAGVDVWDTSDQFRYVYQPFTGDIEITGRVVSLENTDAWAKAGVMIRETLAATAVQTSLVVTPAQGTNFYRRLTPGALTQPGAVGTAGAPYWVRLVRQGSTVTGFQSSDGVTWTAVGTATMATATLYVGLEVTSHDPAQAATAVFDNVTVRIPAANQSPTVSLTAPANGATFIAPASIALAATATDVDGTIERLEFYAGSTLLATDTSSPYAYTWSGMATGSYGITAVARDNSGAATTSAVRTVTVSMGSSNLAPVVALTAPAIGATYTAPATITVSASASDTDGTVSSVSFYAGATLIGTDTTNPYSVTWSNVPAQSYSLTAVARDDDAATTTSAARSITVTTSGLPAGWTAADIGAPTIAGTTQYAGGAFTVEGAGVDVWDTSDQFRYVYRPFTGDIEITSRVVSLENTDAWAKAGVMIRETLAATAVQTSLVVTPAQGTNFYRRLTTGAVTQPGPVGPAGAPAWVRLTRRGSTVTGFQSNDGVTWTAVGTATMATATLYVGLEVTSHDPAQAATAVFDNVTVTTSLSNLAPLVSLTAPAAGAVFTAPASVPIAANASDADGSVTRVEFYAGAALIGSDTTAPYSMSWNNVPAGTYGLTAVARDNAGAMTVSGARDIRVDSVTLPRTGIFTPSVNHATAVDRYFLEIFPAGANPLVANPVATRDLGKPPVVSGECTVDVSTTTVALPPGSYIATVTAIGSGGSARSAASPVFIR